MRRSFSVLVCAATFVTAGGFAAPSLADKPAWAGGGGKHEREDDGRRGRDRGERQDRDSRGHHGKHFSDQHTVVVRNYYGDEFRSGHCPPGLAKKHNGCMPPGQAKRWRMGYPLPREVVYYPVPPELVVQLGRPPAGHEYVRVAADILLIAVGTGMVVDAIQDLGRR